MTGKIVHDFAVKAEGVVETFVALDEFFDGDVYATIDAAFS